MKVVIPLLSAAFILPAATAFAQGLVPTLGSKYEFCQERPPEPQWMQNLHVRESYKRLLIQSIYRLEGYQRVAASGDCTCDTLFPPWSNAVQHYNDNFLNLEQGHVRRSVQELCEAEGNW